MTGGDGGDTMEHKTEKGERAVLRDEVLALLKQGEGPLSGALP